MKRPGKRRARKRLFHTGRDLCWSSCHLFALYTYTTLPAMTSTSQPQLALKDRIAALQSKPDGASAHSSAAPARTNTTSASGQPTTPPRGTLRDKINKFERKGGVPIPRGSFGMNVPLEQTGGTSKSRELYGNRIPKAPGKPSAAPLQTSLRSVTAPSAFPRTATPDVDSMPPASAISDVAPLSPDVTGDAPPLAPRKARRLSVSEMVGQYEELDALKDPSSKTSRRSSQNFSSPSPVAAPASEPATASALPTPPQSAAAETTPDTPSPPAEVTETPILKLGKLEPPPFKRMQSNNSNLTSPGAASNAPSTPGSDVHTAEILTAVRAELTPTQVKSIELPVPVANPVASPTEASASSPPPSASKTVPPPIEVKKSPVTVEPSLTPKPAKSKTYKVVVHRKAPEPSARSSIDGGAEPRRSVSSDSHGHAPHLRSKRQFKHLQAQPEPASPARGELSDLLQDASWLEATLGSADFDIPSVSFDSAAPDLGFSLAPSTPAAPQRSVSMFVSTPTTPPHSASQTSLAHSVATSGADGPRTSVSTPTLSLSAAPGSAPASAGAPGSMSPKSTRSTASSSTRRFFSLRKPRASTSSELSSEDSALIATPPSPPDAAAGRADALSMRSGLSVGSTGGGSMRLSPRRGLVGRMLGRSGKTKSMIEDGTPTPIAEHGYTLPSLPSPVHESQFDISLSSADQPSFDLDSFPPVPAHGKAATEGGRRR